MFLLRYLAGAATMLLAFGAQAVTITSYDIFSARPSGFAVGWNHTYNGTILSLSPGIGQPSLYFGGSGTLNDGLLADNRNNNQFFLIEDGTSITLHLDGFYKLSSINLLGQNGPLLSSPGSLTGWSVKINDNIQSFTSTGYGPSCAIGLCNDSVSLLGSGLDELSTNTVTLGNFRGGFAQNSYHSFSIAEIELTANISAVPEPETYALLAAGLGLLGFTARRRKLKAAAQA